MKQLRIMLSFLAVSALLAGCMNTTSSNTYSGNEVGSTATVQEGTIIKKRQVAIESNSGMGGLAGAGAGAAAGSTIGGSGAANVVAAIGGAVIGGLAGNAIDKHVNSNTGYEYIIKLNKGSTIAVVQGPETQLSVGQRVQIISGRKTRVIPL